MHIKCHIHILACHLHTEWVCFVGQDAATATRILGNTSGIAGLLSLVDSRLQSILGPNGPTAKNMIVIWWSMTRRVLWSLWAHERLWVLFWSFFLVSLTPCLQKSSRFFLYFLRGLSWIQDVHRLKDPGQPSWRKAIRLHRPADASCAAHKWFPHSPWATGATKLI